MLKDIYTEYAIDNGSGVIGYVWQRESLSSFYVDDDFYKNSEWVLFKKRIPLDVAISSGLVKRAPDSARNRQS